MLYLINVFFMVWEFLGGRFLVDTFSEKRAYKSKIYAELLFLVCIAAETILAYAIRDSFLIRLTVIIAVATAFLYAMYAERLIKIAALVVLFYGIDVSWDNFFYFLVGPFPEYPEAFFFVIIAISRLVTLLTVFFIRYKFGKNTRIKLSVAEWVGFLFIPVITMFSSGVIALKFVSLENSGFLILIILGMATINMVQFLLIDSVFKREKIIRDDRVLHERTQNELKMYSSISENLEKQRKWTHEFKNHLVCISELARTGALDELKSYVGQVDGELSERADLVDTNNVMVNAILNTKYREALEKGIVFILKVNDLSGLSLSDMDVVTVLSNLLDNALEACEQCAEEKVIKLKFIMEKDHTIISVKNTMDRKPVQSGGAFETTKVTEAQEHGLGIKNVCDVLEKYNAKYKIDYDENEFSFSVVI